MRKLFITLNLFFGFLFAISSMSRLVYAADTAPPVLESLIFIPDSVDTSTGRQIVAIHVGSTDDDSGVKYVQVRFRSPSGSNGGTNCGIPDVPLRVSKCFTYATFDQYSEAGDWTVEIFLTDAAGNVINYSSQDLEDAGFPNKIHVISSSPTDTSSPELSSLIFVPDSIDTSLGEQIIAIQVGSTDDDSGVKYVQVRFRSPSGSNSGVNCGIPDIPLKISKCISYITFDQYSESGDWTVEIFLTDAAGNVINYSSQDLEDAGFPNKIHVTNSS